MGNPAIGIGTVAPEPVGGVIDPFHCGVRNERKPGVEIGNIGPHQRLLLPNITVAYLVKRFLVKHLETGLHDKQQYYI